MLRPLPTDRSRDGLFAPKPDYPYFAEAQRFPYRGADGFDPVDLWWLAEASLLAYVPDEALVRRVLGRAGFPGVTFFSAASTHAVVAEGPETLVVFRGTESGDLEDYKTDLRFTLDGNVHRGFKRALDLVWDDVAARLDGQPCRFTGHSLGAALALLAAARHRGVARPVYTFGAPRVGDATFAEAFSPECFRVVNNNDFVTELPPPVKYRHVGELYYFDSEGALHREPALGDRLKAGLRGVRDRARDTVAAWQRGELRTVPFGSIVDHSPQHYAVRCWNHLSTGVAGRDPGSTRS